VETSCQGLQSTLKLTNEVIREKTGVTQTILERMENNMLKWYRHVECMGDNTWPKIDLTAGKKKKKRQTRNEAGKGSGKDDEEEEEYKHLKTQ
jgi:hypothetical protein